MLINFSWSKLEKSNCIVKAEMLTWNKTISSITNGKCSYQANIQVFNTVNLLFIPSKHEKKHRYSNYIGFSLSLKLKKNLFLFFSLWLCLKYIRFINRLKIKTTNSVKTIMHTWLWLIECNTYMTDMSSRRNGTKHSQCSWSFYRYLVGIFRCQ